MHLHQHEQKKPKRFLLIFKTFKMAAQKRMLIH